MILHAYSHNLRHVPGRFMPASDNVFGQCALALRSFADHVRSDLDAMTIP